MAAPPIVERHLPHFHRRAPVLEAVRVATTANITIATALNNGDSLDGVTLVTGDRVLVKDQSTASQNGIYEVGASPARAYDVSTDDPNFGWLVYVKAGTANGQTLWENTNTSAPTIGSTSLTFQEVSGGSGNAFDTFQDHGNTGSTETFDAVTAHHHRAVLNAATVTFTFTGATTGESWSMVLELVQDGTGGRLVSWPGSVVWVDGSAPTLSTGAGAIDFLTFVSHDGGTTWFGFEGGSGTTITDIVDLPTAETDDTLVLAPDGAGGVEWRAETGGTSPTDANIWRPVLDGAGAVVADGSGQAVMAYGPA